MINEMASPRGARRRLAALLASAAFLAGAFLAGAVGAAEGAAAPDNDPGPAPVPVKAAKGREILRCGFTEKEMGAWKMGGVGELATEGGRGVVKIAARPVQFHNKITLPLDVRPYAGQMLAVKARVRYAGVDKPSKSWNGVKLMLVYDTKSGGKRYCQAPGMHGDSGWKEIAFSEQVATDALAGGYLTLGLEESHGTAWFSDLRVTALAAEEAWPRLAPMDYRAEYSPRVLGDAPRRGAMSPGSFSPKVIARDLPDLKGWGANLIRWQLVRNWGKENDNQDVDEYLAWVQARLPEVKQVLDKARELGMKVALDLHVPPGGRRAGGAMNMFFEQKYADAFVAAWRLIAHAVKGHPALYGYDLINEPCTVFDAPIDYLRLQYDAALAVRAIDPDTPLIVEADGWDSPSCFSHLSPLPLKDVIYQVHMYAPHSYTHQGVSGNPLSGAYPGKFGGKFYDREALREVLRPVAEFAARHGAKIYVGEFSAIRWAPGAERYLDDCLSIFAEQGWDWSYHAFREWPGWSVEHAGDAQHTAPAADTPRKQVLLKYFRAPAPSAKKND